MPTSDEIDPTELDLLEALVNEERLASGSIDGLTCRDQPLTAVSHPSLTDRARRNRLCRW